MLVKTGFFSILLGIVYGQGLFDFYEIVGPIEPANPKMAYPKGQLPDFITPYDSRWSYESTPKYTFDDQDPAGYIIDILRRDVETYEYPFVWGEQTFYSAWILVTTFYLPPKLGFGGCIFCNCTAAGNGKYGPSNWYGVANGVKICEPEQCCSYFSNVYRINTDDTQLTHANLNADIIFGGCDIPHEHAYCSWLPGQWYNCQEFSISPYERAGMIPCADLSFSWLLTCVIWLNFPPNYVKTEGEGKFFASKLTALENLNYLSWFENPDFVCHPYSYFFPMQSENYYNGRVTGETSGTVSAQWPIYALVTPSVFL